MKVKYLIPGIPLVARLLIFAALACLGLYLQLFRSQSEGIVPLSLLCLSGASLFLMMRNYKNKPLDLGLEDWKPATSQEFLRLQDNFKQTRKVKPPLFYSRKLGSFFIIVSLVLVYLFYSQRLFGYLLLVADGFILLFPFLFTGVVVLWSPAHLGMKIERLAPVYKAILKENSGLGVTPYLRLDKDKAGRQIPEDVRLLVEPKRKPDDFMGIQLQVAINNGPNGAVPYMYGVFLCRGKGVSFTRLSQLEFKAFVKEPGGDDEYSYVVVRQPTSGGGYHTTGSGCLKLYAVLSQGLEAIVGV